MRGHFGAPHVTRTSRADTIVAIATPPGRGGIGIVRLSGPDAHPIARRLTSHDAPFQPRHATLTTVRLKSDTPGARPLSLRSDTTPAAVPAFNPIGAIDHAVVTFFPTPASYTGDDVVEVSAHGSPVVLNAIVTAAVANGSLQPSTARRASVYAVNSGPMSSMTSCTAGGMRSFAALTRS